jgi:cobalamin biosynthesis protein CobW
MSLTAKIPATVITGFLGAGKTSMVRHLLEKSGGRRIALVINEFGELGVDAEIVRACGIEGCGEDDIVELANGCICCTVADDFLPTIEALLSRPEPPEHIVIETSGLALPKPLLRAFNWPEVRSRVTVDGVVAVLDGPAVAAGRFAAEPERVAAQRAADPNLDHDSPLNELYEDQLACADLVVVNKQDLLSEADRALVEAAVRGRLRPAVKLMGAAHGRVAPGVLLGLGAAAEADVENRPSVHDDEPEHEHDDFESFVLALPELASPESLLVPLAEAIARQDILRVKGFMAVGGKAMRLLVQGVGPRLQHYYDRPWRPDEPRLSRLVVIGQKGLDRGAVEKALGLATG